MQQVLPRGATPGSKPTGVGIGLRRVHYDEVQSTALRIDWLEIAPENFVDRGGRAARVLEACSARWTIVPHGVSLSLGGPDPLDLDFLRKTKAILDRIGAPYFTEHACLARAGGAQFHDLIPLPWTEEAARHMAARIRQTADVLERPVAVENISTYAVMPGSRLTESAFVRAVCEEADCGLLLDVNNVYVNAQNHGRPALELIAELPLERTRHIHMAGHRNDGWVLIDDHGSAVIDPVWDLYREVIRRAGPVPTLIEWDVRIPALEVVLAEADKARAIALQEHPTAGTAA
jgi:uncharacterized protein